MRTPLLSTLFCLLLTFSMYAQNTSPYWSLNGNSNATLSHKIGTTNSVSLRFVTNNIERMKIHSSGNIGIGIPTPLQKLHVGGNGVFTGNLGIGTTAPSKKLHVVGNSLFQGYTQITSKNYVGLEVAAEFSSGNPEFDDEVHTEVGISGTGDYNGVAGHATYRNGSGVYGDGEIGVWGEGAEYGVIGRGYGWGIYGVGLNGSVGVYGNSPDGGYAGFFEGDIYTPSMFTASDQNLKKDIAEFGEALSVIGKLKPKYYTFRNDGKYAKLNLPKGTHYGLIAQELETILPDMVRTTKHKLYKDKPEDKSEEVTIKAVNYTELIPIVIKAMQEQQEVINQQQQQIDALKNELAEIKQAVSKLANNQNINTYLSSAQLSEVIPNPVKGSASIQYSVPEGSRRAQLLITDALGRSIRQVSLSTSGVVNIDVSALANGIYNYSLIVDNKTMVTKKMTVVR
jgi:hypothetical protein